jgi:hypothetical protein
MKYLFLLLFASCTAARYIPDQQIQVILINAYQEDRNADCPLPNKYITWHCDLRTSDGRIIPHHYFPPLHGKRTSFVIGDKYTLRYSTADSSSSYIYAELKKNN